MGQSHIVSDIEQIKALEQISSQLELDEEMQAWHFGSVLNHAQDYLASIEHAPAYSEAFDQKAFIEAATISDKGEDLDHLLGHLTEHVNTTGISTTSGRFAGFIPGGGLVHSALGDFLAAISNRYAGYYAASPGAATLEDMLLKWIGQVLDYPATSTGYLASGGSIANLTAIVTARDTHNITGDKIPKAVVYLTEHVHHCIDKALHIAGLSQSVRRTVPVDDRYRMDASALESQILADKAAGLDPFMVIASAGTTNTGSVDPLISIGQIAEAHELWYHVDGAYGGLFNLCPEGAEILDGIGLSDSVVVDPHKTLFLPYGTGAVIIKDARKHLAAFSAHADYLDMSEDEHVYSAADLSPELTKHFRGLRLWLPLKVFGTDVFRAALSEKIHLARYFHQQMSQADGFVVGHTPDLSVVTYRYLPERGNADIFNEQLMKAINAGGEAFISSTRLDGNLILRAAIMSFRTHLDDIEAIMDSLRFHAAKLTQT